MPPIRGNNGKLRQRRSATPHAPNGNGHAPARTASASRCASVSGCAAITDRDLLIWYRAGDDQALEALFDRYEETLFAFLLAILRDHHLAEDALQETWCRALENLDKVSGDHMRGWLFTVGYRQAMLYRRQLRDEPSYQGVPGQVADPAACPVSRAEEKEEHSRLRELLGFLPQTQQDVIRQRIYEGKRFREIADTLDCPVNTALARMHEGLKRLRRLLGADYA
jgi:RNA polymerase sigma-70 factor (ECF subfamily)